MTVLYRCKGGAVMDVLIVVDMQKDFVSGALGTKEAVEIVPYVVGRVVVRPMRPPSQAKVSFSPGWALMIQVSFF